MKKIQVKINGEWKDVKTFEYGDGNIYVTNDHMHTTVKLVDIRLLNESAQYKAGKTSAKTTTKRYKKVLELLANESECEHWAGCVHTLDEMVKPKIEKLDMENNEFNYDHNSTGNMFSRKREIILLAKKINELIDQANQKE